MATSSHLQWSSPRSSPLGSTALTTSVSRSVPLKPYLPRRSTESPVRGDSGSTIAPDIDSKLGELHEAQVREMRERMAAVKELREGVHANKEALSGIAARMDELLFDLRSEVPRLKQENQDLATCLQQTQSQLDSTGHGVEDLGARLLAEQEARQQAERAAHLHTTDLLNNHDGRVNQALQAAQIIQEKAQERLSQLNAGLEGLGGVVQTIDEKFQNELYNTQQRHQSLANDVLGLRGQMEKEYQQLCSQGLHCASLVERLDEKLVQITPSLQKWTVDLTVPRLDALEGRLKNETLERMEGLRVLSQAVTSGHGQMQSMQSKLDEGNLRLAASRGPFSPRTSGPSSPRTAAPPLDGHQVAAELYDRLSREMNAKAATPTALTPRSTMGGSAHVPPGFGAPSSTAMSSPDLRSSPELQTTRALRVDSLGPVPLAVVPSTYPRPGLATVGPVSPRQTVQTMQTQMVPMQTVQTIPMQLSPRQTQAVRLR